eukprot:TRINITY_DN17485_c0_g1_i1.p1 TRINITY_DN17485_c0_g1~~TRINITY_DN17485_c0_g1_i1.p1  ORF type:complete len:247 (-),score=48.57 TRINITY_DN17485_c0_g1_i1:179-919(-)
MHFHMLSQPMAHISFSRSVQASEAAGRRRGSGLHPPRLLLASALLLAIVHLGLRGLSFVGNVPVLRHLRYRVKAIASDSGEIFERFDKDEEAPVGGRDAAVLRQTNRKAEEEPRKVDERWFVGSIKSYSTAKGFGFIQCNESFSEYQADVFLHQNQVKYFLGGKAYEGDKVRFNLEMNKQGKPQARNVEPISDTPKVSPSKNFVGRVKDYDAEKGYGFIGCEETHNIFKSDIFLHKNQAAGLEKGE